MKRSIGTIAGLAAMMAAGSGMAINKYKTHDHRRIAKVTRTKLQSPEHLGTILKGVGIKKTQKLNYLYEILKRHTPDEVVAELEKHGNSVEKLVAAHPVFASPQAFHAFLSSLKVKELPAHDQLHHLSKVLSGLTKAEIKEAFSNNDNSVQQVLKVHRIYRPGLQGGNRDSGNAAGGGSG